MADDAGSLLVVTGPPAAGKTTVARLLAGQRSPSVHLHADDFWAFIVNGYVEPWLSEAHQQNETVIRAICDTAATFGTGGFRVVLDGVVGPWFVDEMARRCRLLDVDYVILLPTLDRLLDNLAGRTGHGFTSTEAATKMHREFAHSVAAYRRHVIDPATRTPEEVVAAIDDARVDGRFRLWSAGGVSSGGR